MSLSAYSLPPLPQVRPSSGSSPSSRNRSVARLRTAVSEVRQTWQQNDNDYAAAIASVSAATASISAATTSSSSGSPSSLSMLTPGGPKPYVVRMPLRAKTPMPSSSSSSSSSKSPGGGDESSSSSSSSALSPVPFSPFAFYAGDTSPALASALCRGARLVRAHGLGDASPSESSVSTTQLFGSFKPSRSSTKATGSRPNSSSSNNAESNKKNSKSLKKRSGSANSSARSTTSSAALSSGRRNEDGDLELTEEEAESKALQLTSFDVRPLLEPRSIFYVASLSDAPPQASQIADAFTAGNSRKKLVSVLQRTNGNKKAVRHLSKAYKTVMRFQQDEEDANHKNKNPDLEEASGGGGEASSGNFEAEGGGGGEGSAAARKRRDRDKDPETLAAERALQEEAQKVKNACQLLEQATHTVIRRSGSSSKGGGGEDEVPAANRKALFARFRRILRNAPPSGPDEDSLLEGFSMPTKLIVKLLCDACDIEAPLATQWEILAREEVAAAEATRIAKESRRSRHHGKEQTFNDNSSISGSMMTQAVIAASEASMMAASGGGAGEGEQEGEGGGGAGAGRRLSKSENSGSPRKSDYLEVQNAAHATSTLPSPSHVLFASPTAAASFAMTSGSYSSEKIYLPLRFEPLDYLAQSVTPGAAVRSLTEEFVATIVDPAQFTISNLVEDAQLAAKRMNTSVSMLIDTSPFHPTLKANEISTLVGALQDSMSPHPVSYKQKEALSEVVVSSVFNFIQELLQQRSKWTDVCNSAEDLLEKIVLRAREEDRLQKQRMEMENDSHHQNHHHSVGRSKNRQGGGGGGGRGKSPPMQQSSTTPLRGAKKEMSVLHSPTSPGLPTAPPTAEFPRIDQQQEEEQGGADYYEGEDDNFSSSPTLRMLDREIQICIHQKSFHLPLISDRPHHMTEDFYEQEYIAYSEFSEFQHTLQLRRHIEGFSVSSNAPEETATFALIQLVCNAISSAFRIVLDEETISMAMAGKKNKKKKVELEDLPPRYADRSSVLRLKDFRRVFLREEKVAGPLLPFCIAAFLSDRRGSSRWREHVSVLSFL